MSLIADECQKAGLLLEYLHCPSSPDTYDGIIIPELKLMVIDKTDLHYAGLITADETVQYIDTDTAFDNEKIHQANDTIVELLLKINRCHESAFQCFQSALGIHEEKEKIYIDNMDFLKANELTKTVITRIIGENRLPKPSVTKKRFFGASTPTGAMNFIENLTRDISKRYLLKGRPGTGKSTLLRRLLSATIERGLDAEVYSCALDSNSLDMIIWPDLNICVFDSTAPHLYEPTRPNDEIIDMYAACVKPGTDEEYVNELGDINQRYKRAIQEGTEYLAEAKKHLDVLSGIYVDASDPVEVQRLCGEFIGKLRQS